MNIAPSPFSGTPAGSADAAPDLHVRAKRTGAKTRPQLRRRPDRQRHFRGQQRAAQADVEQPDPRAKIEPAFDVVRRARRAATADARS